jgi:glycogen debranching enzyme
VLTYWTYPHGVASLAQTDEQFHPYHEFPPYYPKDAAYHNGIVWTWLQGPVISELCKAGLKDSAFVLTQNAIHQILRRGAVERSQLLDVLARPVKLSRDSARSPRRGIWLSS